MKEYITIPICSSAVSDLMVQVLAEDVTICDDKKLAKAMRKVVRYYTPCGMSLAEWQLRGRPCNQEY